MNTSKRFIRGVLAAAITAIALPVHAEERARPFDVKVQVLPFTDFKPSSPGKKDFGVLTFQGGAVLQGNRPEFGGFSGLQIVDGGKRIIAISDSGYWLTGTITRDENNNLGSLDKTRMVQIYSGIGPRQPRDKYYRDAEALAISDEKLFVSFEASNVLSQYGFSQTSLDLEPKTIPLPDALKNIDINKGMEALAHAPQKSSLAGHLVTILERHGRRADPTVGWILKPDGASKKEGRFQLRKDRLFDITEAGFLDNGDLLVLERRFTIATGVGMRLRKINGDTIKAGAFLDGPVVFEAGIAHHIDNMEAMSIYQNAAGETIIAFLSDDNHSVLQRTIFLEFILKTAS